MFINGILHSTFFFFLAMWLVGSKFPDQGLNLSPLKWKHWVLSTGLPGNSRNTTQHWKIMGYILLNVTTWKSHKHYEQKGPDWKEYNTVWFHLCDEQDRQNLCIVVEVRIMVTVGGKLLTEKATKEILGNENVLYFDLGDDKWSLFPSLSLALALAVSSLIHFTYIKIHQAVYWRCVFIIKCNVTFNVNYNM